MIRYGKGSSGYAFLTVVVDHHAQRAQHSHGTWGIVIEVLTYAGLKCGHLYSVILLGNTDTAAELTNGSRSIAATAQAGNGGQTRIVPAIHMALGHQQIELALGGNGILKIQTAHLILMWMAVDADIFKHPVIQTAVVLELQSTDRVCDVLDGVRNTVGKVVHWVNAPLVTGHGMAGITDAVDNRVTHADKWRGHVYFGAQTYLAFLKLAIAHLLEQSQIFLYRTITIWAVAARLLQGATVLTDFIRGQLINIGKSLFNQLYGIAVQALKVI